MTRYKEDYPDFSRPSEARNAMLWDSSYDYKFEENFDDIDDENGDCLNLSFETLKILSTSGSRKFSYEKEKHYLASDDYIKNNRDENFQEKNKFLLNKNVKQGDVVMKNNNTTTTTNNKEATNRPNDLAKSSSNNGNKTGNGVTASKETGNNNQSQPEVQNSQKSVRLRKRQSGCADNKGIKIIHQYSSRRHSSSSSTRGRNESKGFLIPSRSLRIVKNRNINIVTSSSCLSDERLRTTLLLLLCVCTLAYAMYEVSMLWQRLEQIEKRSWFSF